VHPGIESPGCARLAVALLIPCADVPEIVVEAVGTAAARLLRDKPDSASRILDTTQIRRLIAFSSAVDVTIQHFHGAP
jgi:hypothetical protein